VVENLISFGIEDHTLRTQNVRKAVYFMPKKSGFAKEASFSPILTISAINSELRLACYNVSFFILVKLTAIY